MMRIMPRTAWSLGLGLQPWEIKFLIYLHNLNLWVYLINVWINGNVYFSGLFSNGHKWVWASLIKARHWKIKFIRWAFLPCLSTVFPPIVSGNYSPFFWNWNPKLTIHKGAETKWGNMVIWNKHMMTTY